jgi:hypothetical protein
MWRGGFESEPEFWRVSVAALRKKETPVRLWK